MNSHKVHNILQLRHCIEYQPDSNTTPSPTPIKIKNNCENEGYITNNSNLHNKKINFLYCIHSNTIFVIKKDCKKLAAKFALLQHQNYTAVK